MDENGISVYMYMLYGRIMDRWMIMYEIGWIWMNMDMCIGTGTGIEGYFTNSHSCINIKTIQRYFNRIF